MFKKKKPVVRRMPADLALRHIYLRVKIFGYPEKYWPDSWLDIWLRTYVFPKFKEGVIKYDIVLSDEATIELLKIVRMMLPSGDEEIAAFLVMTYLVDHLGYERAFLDWTDLGQRLLLHIEA